MEGSSSMPLTNWQSQFSKESRQKIVRKMYYPFDRMEASLKKFLTPTSMDLTKLEHLVSHVEERCFSKATSENDYLRKVCMCCLSMEGKQNAANARQPDLVVGNHTCGVEENKDRERTPGIPLPIFCSRKAAFLTSNLQNNTGFNMGQTSNFVTIAGTSRNSEPNPCANTTNLAEDYEQKQQSQGQNVHHESYEKRMATQPSQLQRQSIANENSRAFQQGKQLIQTSVTKLERKAEDDHPVPLKIYEEAKAQ